MPQNVSLYLICNNCFEVQEKSILYIPHYIKKSLSFFTDENIEKSIPLQETMNKSRKDKRKVDKKVGHKGFEAQESSVVKTDEFNNENGAFNDNNNNNNNGKNLSFSSKSSLNLKTPLKPDTSQSVYSIFKSKKGCNGEVIVIEDSEDFEDFTTSHNRKDDGKKVVEKDRDIIDLSDNDDINNMLNYCINKNNNKNNKNNNNRNKNENNDNTSIYDYDFTQSVLVTDKDSRVAIRAPPEGSALEEVLVKVATEFEMCGELQGVQLSLFMMDGNKDDMVTNDNNNNGNNDINSNNNKNIKNHNINNNNNNNGKNNDNNNFDLNNNEDNKSEVNGNGNDEEMINQHITYLEKVLSTTSLNSGDDKIFINNSNNSCNNNINISNSNNNNINRGNSIINNNNNRGNSNNNNNNNDNNNTNKNNDNNNTNNNNDNNNTNNNNNNDNNNNINNSDEINKDTYKNNDNNKNHIYDEKIIIKDYNGSNDYENYIERNNLKNNDVMKTKNTKDYSDFTNNTNNFENNSINNDNNNEVNNNIAKDTNDAKKHAKYTSLRQTSAPFHQKLEEDDDVITSSPETTSNGRLTKKPLLTRFNTFNMSRKVKASGGLRRGVSSGVLDYPWGFMGKDGGGIIGKDDGGSRLSPSDDGADDGCGDDDNYKKNDDFNNKKNNNSNNKNNNLNNNNSYNTNISYDGNTATRSTPLSINKSNMSLLLDAFIEQSFNVDDDDDNMNNNNSKKSINIDDADDDNINYTINSKKSINIDDADDDNINYTNNENENYNNFNQSNNVDKNNINNNNNINNKTDINDNLYTEYDEKIKTNIVHEDNYSTNSHNLNNNPILEIANTGEITSNEDFYWKSPVRCSAIDGSTIKSYDRANICEFVDDFFDSLIFSDDDGGGPARGDGVGGGDDGFEGGEGGVKRGDGIDAVGVKDEDSVIDRCLIKNDNNKNDDNYNTNSNYSNIDSKKNGNNTQLTFTQAFLHINSTFEHNNSSLSGDDNNNNNRNNINNNNFNNDKCKNNCNNECSNKDNINKLKIINKFDSKVTNNNEQNKNSGGNNNKKNNNNGNNNCYSHIESCAVQHSTPIDKKSHVDLVSLICASNSRKALKRSYDQSYPLAGSMFSSGKMQESPIVVKKAAKKTFMSSDEDKEDDDGDGWGDDGSLVLSKNVSLRLNEEDDDDDDDFAVDFSKKKVFPKKDNMEVLKKSKNTTTDRKSIVKIKGKNREKKCDWLDLEAEESGEGSEDDDDDEDGDDDDSIRQFIASQCTQGTQFKGIIGQFFVYGVF